MPPAKSITVSTSFCHGPRQSPERWMRLRLGDALFAVLQGTQAVQRLRLLDHTLHEAGKGATAF